MRNIRFILFLFFIFWLSGCAQSSQGAEAIQEQVLSLQPGQAVAIRVDSGVVNIVGTDASQASFSGQLREPGRTIFQVTNDSSQVTIKAEYQRSFFSPSQPAVNLDVQIPQGVLVSVIAFDAAVTVRDLRGKVTVNTTAGSILAENLSGDISLRSVRGDVTARESWGTARGL